MFKILSQLNSFLWSSFATHGINVNLTKRLNVQKVRNPRCMSSTLLSVALQTYLSLLYSANLVYDWLTDTLPDLGAVRKSDSNNHS